MTDPETSEHLKSMVSILSDIGACITNIGFVTQKLLDQHRTPIWTGEARERLAEANRCQRLAGEKAMALATILTTQIQEHN